MSKRNDDQPAQDQTDQNPAGENIAADNPGSGGNNLPPDNNPGSGNNDAEPKIPTIEEHAQKLKVDAPVFAAVMQSNKWASGRRVPEADFKKAVEGFLTAPMGGK